MLRELDRINIKDFMEERQQVWRIERRQQAPARCKLIISAYFFILKLESRQAKELEELKNFHKKEREQLDANFQKVTSKIYPRNLKCFSARFANYLTNRDIFVRKT